MLKNDPRIPCVYSSPAPVNHNIAGISLHHGNLLRSDENRYLCRPQPVLATRLKPRSSVDVHLQLRDVLRGCLLEHQHEGVLLLQHLWYIRVHPEGVQSRGEVPSEVGRRCIQGDFTSADWFGVGMRKKVGWLRQGLWRCCTT